MFTENLPLATVLLLESARANGLSFAPHLNKRYTLLVANTGKDALDMARQYQPDILVVDAASMRTSGDRICHTLRNIVGNLPIIHIKAGPPEANSESVANSLLYMPFTYRKLCNRIERYIQPESGEVLKAGRLELNLQQEILNSPNGEFKLTPKLTRLMALLMENLGEIVERRTLMKEVWQTDYMGDTRTLDVHIRWIRQAVEADPSHPRYIKTVRGKGYRLEVSD
jgi:DNA-binding response OmpR family regulator